MGYYRAWLLVRPCSGQHYGPEWWPRHGPLDRVRPAQELFTSCWVGFGSCFFGSSFGPPV